jgi:excisionase family DNA binding protein
MSTTAPHRPLLRVRDAAAKANVSERTIRRLIRKGELPALKVGGQVRLDADELERWLYGESS